jgi:hypothetical protein
MERRQSPDGADGIASDRTREPFILDAVPPDRVAAAIDLVR